MLQKYFWFKLYIVLLAALDLNPINAQTYCGGGLGWLNPVGGLTSRFSSAFVPILEGGYQRDESSKIIFQYQPVVLFKVNRAHLYYDNLDMRLNNHSLALLFERSVWKPVNYCAVSLYGGVSLNRWSYRLKGFHQADTLMAVGGEDSVVVVDNPPFGQQDWSWGGRIGACVTLTPFRFIECGWRCDYHLLIAELWPLLNVRLENVSGLQTATLQFFVRFKIN